MGCSASHASVVPEGATPDGVLAAKKKGSSYKRLLDEYAVGEQLGEGAFGVVYNCKRKSTGAEVAVKMVDKVETPVDSIKREVDMLKGLDHHNVVRFHNVYYERCFVCIVMDKYCGGDLVEGMQRHLREKGKINCYKIKHVSRQMVAAVHYLHGSSIVHRDVKGDNYLMDRKDITDPQCRIALSDFGTAYNMKPNERLKDEVGTKIFWAPEFYNKNYGLKVDIWAIGVIMYGLLDGRFPFKDESDIRTKEPRYPTKIDPDCEGFIRAMLRKDEDARFSAEGVAAHKWIRTTGSTAAPGDAAADHLRRSGGGDDVCCHSGENIRTEAVNDGIHSRRQELLQRMNEKHGAVKNAHAVKEDHFWAQWFTITDKAMPGLVNKFEWWDMQKAKNNGILAFQGASERNQVSGELDRSPHVVGRMLQEHNIDTSKFGVGDAKSLEQLAAEVQSGNARLMLDATEHKKLVRVVDVVLLRIFSQKDLKSGKILIETAERYPDGRRREIPRMPGSKKRPHENAGDAARRTLKELLCMGDCSVHLDLSTNEVFEDEFESPSFPGVRTVYRKEVVQCYVEDATPSEVLAKCGLPAGSHWTAEDPRHNVKYLEWMTEKQALGMRVKLRAEGSEEVSGLVQAPIGMKEADLASYLQAGGVDISRFGQDGCVSLRDFSAELVQGASSIMASQLGEVVRVVDLVHLKVLRAKSGEVLVHSEMTRPNGETTAIHCLPGGKRRPDENQFLSARRILRRQLRIDENQVQLDAGGVKYYEEERMDPHFPGVRTVYRTHLITVQLLKRRNG